MGPVLVDDYDPRWPEAFEQLRAPIWTVVKDIALVHRGDLGVEGREAFDSPGGPPRHHLYACASRSVALANHLTVRDYLRTHPDTAREYGDLKKRLALESPHDIDHYVEGKTDFILGILRAAGFSPARLDAIERVNRKIV
jgi:GrpB-like predicted nucleotidyltransferase (UPF0157 family)